MLKLRGSPGLCYNQARYQFLSVEDRRTIKLNIAGALSEEHNTGSFVLTPLFPVTKWKMVLKGGGPLKKSPLIMKISDFLFDRRSCLWFCRTNEFSSGAPILACWHICCSAQNLPPTRYNTQPSHPTVYTRHPLCIPFGSAYGVSYTYAPSSIIQLLFHKSRTIQRGANQDEYDFFLFSCFLRQVESSIFSKIYSAEACSADVWYG